MSPTQVRYDFGSGLWVPFRGNPPVGEPPVWVTTSLNAMTEGAAFTQTLSTSSLTSVTYTLFSGALPDGLTLAGGVISGTPTEAGAYSLTIRATNSDGYTDRPFSGVVASAGGLIPATSLTELNTGYQSSMGSLTNRADGSITTSGTVFQNWNVNGPIYVNAPNVTIRRCVFNAHAWGIEVGPNADGLIVEDSTFIGGENCGVMDDGYADNVTYRRLNIKNGEDGMKLSGQGRTLQNVYIHDLLPRAGNPDPHHDGIQCYSGGAWVFDSCRIESQDTSCIAMFQGQMTADDVTIQNCYLTGGGPGPAYSIYAPGPGMTDIRVIDNIFGAWLYGPVTDWVPGGDGWVWSGNTRFGTGVPVNP